MLASPVLLSLLALGGPPPAAVEDPFPLPESSPEITARELEHHVRVLASDELAGRAVGTEHSRRAARYLARALESAGVEPGGEDGTFLQPVPLVRYVFRSAPRLLLRAGEGTPVEAGFGVGFATSLRLRPSSTGELGLRVARSLEEIPAEASPGEALLVIGSSRKVRGWLAERGMEDGKGWGALVRLGSSRAGRGSPLPGPLLVRPETAEPLPPRLLLRGEVAQLAQAGEFDRLAFECDIERQEIVDYNVVGVLPGRGIGGATELGEEVVVFSAHYDHLEPGHGGGSAEGRGTGTGAGAGAGAGTGTGTGAQAVDLIYNGADDDASGTAAVIELAQAFAAGEAPVRTLVFLLATGEERGLLGTWHYLDHPVRPLEKTVANLNFEMIGRPDELVGGPGRLWLTGYERTNLGAAFVEAGVGIVADPRPEQNFFMRSDNIAFVRRGIVGQSFSTYNMHADYHRVTDEADLLDFEHMERATRAAYAACRLTTHAALRPEWLPGGLPR